MGITCGRVLAADAGPKSGPCAEYHVLRTEYQVLGQGHCAVTPVAKAMPVVRSFSIHAYSKAKGQR